MKKRTYILCSLAVCIPFILIEPVSIFGLLPSILPDLGDEREEDKTLKHSLISLIITTSFAITIDISLGLVWIISYVIHILLDSFLGKSIKFFYPLAITYEGSNKFISHKEENLISIALIGIIALNFLLCI